MRLNRNKIVIPEAPRVEDLGDKVIMLQIRPKTSRYRPFPAYWKDLGEGYTNDINEAHRYSRESALWRRQSSNIILYNPPN
jgi:hypothetical protein